MSAYAYRQTDTTAPSDPSSVAATSGLDVVAPVDPTSPLVMVVVPEDLSSPADTETWYDEAFKTPIKNPFTDYIDKCLSAADLARATLRSTPGASQTSQLDEVQARLNEIDRTAFNFRAVAVDSGIFDSAWKTYRDNFNLSRSEAGSGFVAISVENEIDQSTKPKSSRLRPREWFRPRYSQLSGNEDPQITYKVVVTTSKQREAAKIQLDDLALQLQRVGRVLSNGETARLLRGYPGCRTVRFPAGSLELPLFENVNSRGPFADF